MRYKIRVHGHLDPLWFENLVLTHEQDGTTLLTGPIPDRAALYGILLKMSDLGLTLLLLEALVSPEQPEH